MDDEDANLKFLIGLGCQKEMGKSVMDTKNRFD